MPLSIALSPEDPLAASVDALVICVFHKALAEHPTLLALPAALRKALLDHAAQVEFEGKVEQTLDLTTLGQLPAQRLVLIGAGGADELSPARLRTIAAAAVRVGAQNAKSIVIVLPRGEIDVRTVGEGIVLGSYRFKKYFTGDRKAKVELGKIGVSLPGVKPAAQHKKALALGVDIAGAVSLARDAINEPPNVLHPEGIAALGREIARRHQFKIKVLDAKGIHAAGMNLHYAVGQGSSNEPRFIHITYSPRKKKKKVVFVGKGLTFDSGGLCIKPAPGMGEMKSDMGGAAAVLGLMEAVGVLRPDIEVHGIVGAAENMPDGSAYRPADVFTSLDGKTVEIINTDAEGRLVLADSLTYAARLKPDLIIDAATLTGAALVALGKTWSAFYTDSDELAHKFSDAAGVAGEGFWRMPLIAELGDQLKSDIADLKHTGDRYGGSITAALFLREFVGKTPWIHCDIAGPVLSDRAHGVVPKGGTGHAVLTFLSLLEDFAR
jgi:leucyl aminopeptidase